MVIGILTFPEGTLTLNYFLFCTAACLGVLQIAAAQSRLIGLMLLPAAWNRWLGLALASGAYAWFFWVQPDLFIPGLAGGELFAIFLGGFVVAVIISIGLGLVSNRLPARLLARIPERRRESIQLEDGGRAELWQPHSARTPGEVPPLIVGLREAEADSLDALAAELVGGGAAVLLCGVESADAAAHWASQHERHSLMGVGRGADRALELATGGSWQAVLALAPFGDGENARPGLRWLRETDFVTALRATWRRSKSSAAVTPLPPNTRVIYGDEDLLVRPAVARKLYPAAIVVAGERHLTLAASAAVARLAAELFDVRLLTGSWPVPANAARMRGEARE